MFYSTRNHTWNDAVSLNQVRCLTCWYNQSQPTSWHDNKDDTKVEVIKICILRLNGLFVYDKNWWYKSLTASSLHQPTPPHHPQHPTPTPTPIHPCRLFSKYTAYGEISIFRYRKLPNAWQKLPELPQKISCRMRGVQRWSNRERWNVCRWVQWAVENIIVSSLRVDSVQALCHHQNSYRKMGTAYMLNPLEPISQSKLLTLDYYYLIWLLIDIRLCCQQMRSRFRKLLLPKRPFNKNFFSNAKPMP